MDEGIRSEDRKRIQVAMSIAGFDPSSGAGVSADMKVFAAHGLFGTSVITASTVQSTLGVRRVEVADPALLGESLACLCGDVPPAGIKIGMLGSGVNAQAIILFLKAQHEAARGTALIPIVFDPVLQSSSGASLLDREGVLALRVLLPLVHWVTPNWQELATLTGLPVTTAVEAETAADALGMEFPTLGIVATGGDQAVPNDLVRLSTGEKFTLEGHRIDTTSTHGTGCAFSSAMLAGLVQGKLALEAARAAKSYVTEALRRAPGLGKGRGPLHLLWPLD